MNWIYLKMKTFWEMMKLSKFKCLQCNWKGKGEFTEKATNGDIILIFDCPKCGANIYSKTMGSEYEKI